MNGENGPITLSECVCLHDREKCTKVLDRVYYVDRRISLGMDAKWGKEEEERGEKEVGRWRENAGRM